MFRLLDRAKFTALVCHNDPVAMGGIGAPQERGIEVPRDMSVASFYAVSVPAGFSPTITSVGFLSIDMGRAAVRMHLETPFEMRQEDFPIELHVRESTSTHKAQRVE